MYVPAAFLRPAYEMGNVSLVKSWKMKSLKGAVLLHEGEFLQCCGGRYFGERLYI